MSHTPGPWTVIGEYVAVADGLPVAQVGTFGWMHPDVIQGNARLIAAAPELLRVIKSMSSKDMELALPLSLRSELRQLVAKAEGK